MNSEKIKYLIDHYSHLVPDEKSNLKYPYFQERELAAEQKRIAEIILRDYEDKVRLNYCPKCGYLARTPSAKQCRSCWHSWHDTGANDR